MMKVQVMVQIAALVISASSRVTSSFAFSLLNAHKRAATQDIAHMTRNEIDCYEYECNRREYIKEAVTGTVGVVSVFPIASHAATSDESKEQPETFKKGKSRSAGYEVQHSASEWSTLLSGSQYNVLRKGGTERQRSSILEKEKRVGTFVCAGCNSDLFVSTAKFNSGTGWPSFDSPINNSAVEVEDVGWGLKALDGAEVRCRTCGGHLGDVFEDGWRYGSKTGKRYCINGAALIFLPVDGGGKGLRGDIPPPNKVIQYEPSLIRD
jgi:peptide-methionine (R)-S-oxide reductase